MNKDNIVSAITFLVLVVLAISSAQAIEQKDGLLKVYFLNVGQGDAIFIEAPNGNQILIDGGPDNSVVSELARVMPFYDRSIDAVIVSHPHSDHISGLIDVMERYDVRHVIEAGEQYDSGEFRAWKEAIKNENAVVIEAIAGREIDLGGGAMLAILHPLVSVAGTFTKTPHDDSVVAVLRYRNIKVLFTGDMEADVEKVLVNYNINVDADVLKVGHHGSRTSTSQIFLDAVSPQAAVIQVGARNRYKHPTDDVLSRLENFGTTLYRTDTNGAVILTSDGDTFSIKPSYE